MSFLRKVEIRALKENRKKTVKPKSAKAKEPVSPDSRKHKKAVNAFFKFMEAYLGAELKADEFVSAMTEIWKDKKGTQAKTYTSLEFPELLKFLRAVQSAAQKGKK